MHRQAGGLPLWKPIEREGAYQLWRRLSDHFGRKHVLVVGWLVAVPVPFLLMWAPGRNWILFANLLLGISQGLTWSTTVVMKIDLVGSKQRGQAMGLNEFAGYVAVAPAGGNEGVEFGVECRGGAPVRPVGPRHPGAPDWQGMLSYVVGSAREAAVILKRRGAVWTTDASYRETPEQLQW